MTHFAVEWMYECDKCGAEECTEGESPSGWASDGDDDYCWYCLVTEQENDD